MITISTTALISEQSHAIVIEGVPEGDYDVVVVLQPRSNEKKPVRRIGFGKGAFIMADDFNEPLEDFKAYM